MTSIDHRIGDGNMAGAARAQGPAAAPWLRRLTFGLLGFYVLLSVYVLWRAALLTPYFDEIDWILRWREFQAHGDWGRYLLEPVNLHRLPMIFGLIAFDIAAFGGTNVPLILSGALGLAVMAAMLGREAAKAAPPPLALPAAALAVMVALMGSNVLDAATPICVNYIHGASLAVLAMVLAEGDQRRGMSWRRLGALAAAMAAAFGDAAALAVWPVFAIGAVRRRDWTWLAAVLAAGAAFVGAYAWGQGEATHGSTAGALANPLLAIRLALNLLVLPWTVANIHLASIAGLVIAAVGLAGVALRGGRGASRSERIACSFVLFSLGVAAMAGLGRTTPDALNTPLRYGVLLAPLQTGLLMLALPYVGELWRANRSLVQALCAAVLVLATVQDVLMAVAAVRTNDKIRTVLADYHAGRRTPEMLVFVHPDLAHAERVYADMRRDGMFQRELHLKRLREAR